MSSSPQPKFLGEEDYDALFVAAQPYVVDAFKASLPSGMFGNPWGTLFLAVDAIFYADKSNRTVMLVRHISGYGPTRGSILKRGQTGVRIDSIHGRSLGLHLSSAADAESVLSILDHLVKYRMGGRYERYRRRTIPASSRTKTQGQMQAEAKAVRQMAKRTEARIREAKKQQKEGGSSQQVTQRHGSVDPIELTADKRREMLGLSTNPFGNPSGSSSPSPSPSPSPLPGASPRGSARLRALTKKSSAAPSTNLDEATAGEIMSATEALHSESVVSLHRSLRMATDAEAVSTRTMEQVQEQGESIDRMRQDTANLNYNLDVSGKIIHSMDSWGGMMRSYFGRDPAMLPLATNAPPKIESGLTQDLSKEEVELLKHRFDVLVVTEKREFIPYVADLAEKSILFTPAAGVSHGSSDPGVFSLSFSELAEVVAHGRAFCFSFFSKTAPGVPIGPFFSLRWQDMWQLIANERDGFDGDARVLLTRRPNAAWLKPDELTPLDMPLLSSSSGGLRWSAKSSASASSRNTPPMGRTTTPGSSSGAAGQSEIQVQANAMRAEENALLDELAISLGTLKVHALTIGDGLAHQSRQLDMLSDEISEGQSQLSKQNQRIRRML